MSLTYSKVCWVWAILFVLFIMFVLLLAFAMSVG